MESDSKQNKLKKKRRRQRRQNARKKLAVKEDSEQKSDIEIIVPSPTPATAPAEMKAAKPAVVESTKTREEILAERQAKKLTKNTKKPQATETSSKSAVPTEKQGSPVKAVSPAPETPAPAKLPTRNVGKATEKTQQVKQQQKPGDAVKVTPVSSEKPTAVELEKTVEKTREEVMAERAAKKQAKQQQKGKPAAAEAKPKITASLSVDETDRVAPKVVETVNLPEKMAAMKIDSDAKAKPVLTKAERRAMQEAQRAAKEAAQQEKTTSKPKDKPTKDVAAKAIVPIQDGDKPKKLPLRRNVTKPALHRVKLFDHLYVDRMTFEKPINESSLHKEVLKLGIQYANNVIVGSNARCIAFLKAMKMVIQDYVPNEQKDFCRELDTEFQPCVDFLEKCRPFSVSMKNALANIKMHKSQLTAEECDEDKKAYLLETIDTYIRDQIEKAAQAISNSVQHKISNGDVILTYGSSSLIKRILKEANDKNDRFSVIVVDSRPSHEGQAMIKRLVKEGIPCKCVQINALGFIMPEVTKVILGAHALLANGCVMGRVGTAQIALVAKSYNVPVLVCCETHKFSERVQTDAFVHNEIANPDDIMLPSYKTGDAAAMADWKSLAHLTPLNIRYDITPPELVTAVITEIAILPCTSVPVILRIKPSEIGY